MIKGIMKHLFTEIDDDFSEYEENEQENNEENIPRHGFSQESISKPVEEKPLVQKQANIIQEDLMKTHSTIDIKLGDFETENMNMNIIDFNDKVEEKTVEKKNFDIKLEEFSDFSYTPKRKEEPKKVETIKIEKEVSQVISPFFGSKDKIEEITADNKIIYKEKRKNDDTVISPFYGRKELQQRAEESKEVLEHVEREQIINSIDLSLKDDEVLNFSLDDVIVANDDADIDEMVQVSLFGDDQIINNE